MQKPDLRRPTPTNRPTLALAATAERLGFNYFEALTLIAMGRWADLKLEVDKGDEATLRLRAIMEGCSYLYPKRKAIELSGPEGGPLEHVLAMDPGQRQRRIAELQGRLAARPVSVAVADELGYPLTDDTADVLITDAGDPDLDAPA